MPPKGKGGKDGKKTKKDPMALLLEENKVIKESLLAKDLEIACGAQKIIQLEERSMYLCNTNETMRLEAQTEIDKLLDIVAFLTSESNSWKSKSNAFEAALEKLKAEHAAMIESYKKQIHDMTDAHEFALANLQLQLDDANVKLRDMHEFSQRRAAIEAEIAGLKEQLEREKKEHQEAISDVERNAVQEKERLKKEMAQKIAETKEVMEKLNDAQLHAKTKKAIAENEHMTKELAYQTRQTELLLQKNERIVQENIELHRTVHLAKEIEDDLARRNHMYQKTMRILVFKLRAVQSSEEQLKRILYDYDIISAETGKEEKERLDMKLKDLVLANAKHASNIGEEAMKFLYACLEDIEFERLVKTPEDGKADSDDGDDPDMIRAAPAPEDPLLASGIPIARLDQLTLQQRHNFLQNLLRTAISIRAVTEDLAKVETYQILTPADSVGGKTASVAVTDILDLPFEKLNLDEPIKTGSKNLNPVQVGLQVVEMELEPLVVQLVPDHLKFEPVKPLDVATLKAKLTAKDNR